MTKKITSQTELELSQFFEDHHEKKYRAKQVFQWLYQKQIQSVEQMHTINQSCRLLLQEHFDWNAIQIQNIFESQDGSFKIIFNLADQKQIEAVVMKHKNHYTICVSSQVGCAMGCKFCLTGTMGLKRNLEAGEIVDQFMIGNQILFSKTGKNIKNIVFMGMGEPLHNYNEVIKSLRIFTNREGLNIGVKKITLSTSGLIPQIQKLALETDLAINLAISLNGSNQENRKQLMPISQKYPIDKLIEATNCFPKKARQRITLEYILIKGVTDDMKYAKELTALVNNSSIKINLIPYNNNPHFHFERPEQSQIYAFQKYLLDHHVFATQRHSKGQDIQAACGQLAIEEQIKKSRVYNDGSK